MIRRADVRTPRTDLAKVSPHVLDPARFALHLGTHLLARYAHVSATFVTVEQLRWARINDSSSSANSSEAGHPHAFWRDGAEKRFVEVEVARQSDGGGAVARVAGGLRDLARCGLPCLLPFHAFI
jgi:urate oxidase